MFMQKTTVVFSERKLIIHFQTLTFTVNKVKNAGVGEQEEEKLTKVWNLRNVIPCCSIVLRNA